MLDVTLKPLPAAFGHRPVGGQLLAGPRKGPRTPEMLERFGGFVILCPQSSHSEFLRLSP